MPSNKLVVSIIFISQFFCSSSWFAVNAIIHDIVSDTNAYSNFLAQATIVVQGGFILGTLCFALFSVADRYSPSLVFFVSAIMVCCTNLVLLLPNIVAYQILLSRCIVGFFLAGIYPVGMKIAADYFEKGLGITLSFLVAALVLGTSFPHLIRSVAIDFSWKKVIYTTSSLTLVGGLFIFTLVPNGPYRKFAQKINFNTIPTIFKNKKFSKAAFGYFGHMWELYTFWAFVPVLLNLYVNANNIQHINISFLSFCIIFSGCFGCIIGGFAAKVFSEKVVATTALSLSCFCCFISPLFFHFASLPILIIFLIFWGMVVIADSPLFSTLVAKNAPKESKGTALTIVNCIGFSITVVSIQFINWASTFVQFPFFTILLAIGPVLGIICMQKGKIEYAN